MTWMQRGMAVQPPSSRLDQGRQPLKSIQNESKIKPPPLPFKKGQRSKNSSVPPPAIAPPPPPTSMATAENGPSAPIDNSALLKRPTIRRHVRRTSTRTRHAFGDDAKRNHRTGQQNISNTIQGVVHEEEEDESMYDTEQKHEDDEYGNDNGADFDVLQVCTREKTAVALFTFESDVEGDLSFLKGEIIKVDAKIGDLWMRGRCGDKQGIFPAAYANFLKAATPEPPPSFSKNISNRDLGKPGPQKHAKPYTTQPPPPPPSQQKRKQREDSEEQKEAEEDITTGSQNVEFDPRVPVFGKECVALYNFDGSSKDDLSFRAGDRISLLEYVGDQWCFGKLREKLGIFPKSYVDIRDVNSSMCIGLYDFHASTSEDLGFTKGTRIEILRYVDEEWYYGRANGKEGIFPKCYVRLDPIELMSDAKGNREHLENGAAIHHQTNNLPRKMSHTMLKIGSAGKNLVHRKNSQRLRDEDEDDNENVQPNPDAGEHRRYYEHPNRKPPPPPPGPPPQPPPPPKTLQGPAAFARDSATLYAKPPSVPPPPPPKQSNAKTAAKDGGGCCAIL